MTLPQEINDKIYNNILNLKALKIQRWWKEIMYRNVHQCVTSELIKFPYYVKKFMDLEPM
jgi:hypothetical protein